MAAPIVTFSTSLRTGSFNRRLAQAFVASACEAGLEAEFLDLADYDMPIYHGDLEASEPFPEGARRLRAALADRSVVFIASPEYNASPSPLALNTLNWLSRIADGGGAPALFGTTTFALGSASPGGLGGYRGLMALRNMLELGLSATVLPQMVSVGTAMSGFDENGRLSDPRCSGMMAGLVSAVKRAVDVRAVMAAQAKAAQ